MKISPALEDYLEAIFLIQKDRNIVRLKDLADFLNVKAPSVHEALIHLKEKGLIQQERYGYIELTKSGENLACRVLEKHRTLKEFLVNVLGLDEEIAEQDACKIEHYLSKETVVRMTAFVKYSQACLGPEKKCLSKFLNFIEAQNE